MIFRNSAISERLVKTVGCFSIAGLTGHSRHGQKGIGIDPIPPFRCNYYMSFPLLDGIEKLINEHGSAVILHERIALAKDQYAALERQVRESLESIATLRVKLEFETNEHEKTKTELMRLKEEHEEEIRIYKAIEFRKGKRTGGKWMAFCPKCHVPAEGGDIGVYRENFARIVCTAGCGWIVDHRTILDYITREVV